MKSSYWRFAAVTLLLGGTLAASRLSEHRTRDSLARPLSGIPNQIDGWVGADAAPLGGRVLEILAPTSYLERVYQRGSQQLSLFIAYYDQQRSGESLHSPKNCLPGSGWEIWNYGSVWIPVDGQKVKINEYSIQKDGNRQLVLYWYQSRQRIIASEYLGKFLLVRDALVDGNSAGSIVRITVADAPGSLEQGVQFASRIIPDMQHCLVR
jgi:EpsI family protein